MADIESLNAAIATSSEALRTLQEQKADAAAIKEEKARLGEYKKQLAAATGGAGGSKAKEKKSARISLKTPKVRITPHIHSVRGAQRKDRSHAHFLL